MRFCSSCRWPLFGCFSSAGFRLETRGRFSCSPPRTPSGYCGVQPAAPMFAVGLAVTSVLLFHGPGGFGRSFPGFLLGLSFACRFQDAFFGPVLLVAGLASRRFGAAAWMSLGAALTITFQGLVDLYTWGLAPQPVSVCRLVRIRGRRAAVRRRALLVLSPLSRRGARSRSAVWRSGLTALVHGGRRFPVLLAASVFYLVMHNLVVHKDFRLFFRRWC